SIGSGGRFKRRLSKFKKDCKKIPVVSFIMCISLANWLGYSLLDGDFVFATLAGLSVVMYASLCFNKINYNVLYTTTVGLSLMSIICVVLVSSPMALFSLVNSIVGTVIIIYNYAYRLDGF